MKHYTFSVPQKIIFTAVGVLAAYGGDITRLVHTLEVYVSLAVLPFFDAMTEKTLELIGRSLHPIHTDEQNPKFSSQIRHSRSDGFRRYEKQLPPIDTASYPKNECVLAN